MGRGCAMPCSCRDARTGVRGATITDSQPRDGGTVRAIDDVVADIRANGLVHDVTLSGGEPFEAGGRRV